MPIYNNATKTAQDVVKRVQRTFGDEAMVQINNTDMFNWINDGQRAIVLDNQVLRTVGTTDITAGLARYPLAGLPILSIQSVRIGGKALKFLNFQKAENHFANGVATAGTPEYWYNFTSELHLHPAPDTSIVGGLQIFYTASPAEVSGLGDKLVIPDIYFNALVQYVLSQAHDLDEDYNAANAKRGEFANSLAHLSEQESYSNNDAYPMITVSPEDM